MALGGMIRQWGCVAALALLVTACGDTSSPGFGTITVTGVTDAGGTSTITGGDFSLIVGEQVEVTYTATAGTPFLGGTSSVVTVPGTITSSSTISSVTPDVVVCGVAMVEATIAVTLNSGVMGTSGGAAIASFAAPTITAITNDLVPGTTFDACNPAPFTLTGTGFAPVGGMAMVRFTATSAAPADMPFGGAATIDVAGTIVSATTITGVSPDATLVPADVATPNMCFSLDATADVDVTLPNGSCTFMPFTGVTFAGPALTSVDVAGFTNPDVPSTILLGNATAETFTLTGTRFGPTGSSAVVTFDLAPPVAVLGTVTSATTVVGTLPVVAPRLTMDMSVRVRVQFLNGSQTYCNDGANFVAPPTVTTIASNLTVREGGAATFLSACPTQMRITGTAFDPAATVSISDAAGAPAALIGTGALNMQVVTPVLITGISPTDPAMLADTNARARIVNPDMQFHDFVDAATPFEFIIRGHLQNSNVSMQAALHNAEMEAAVDPTNPNNMATLVHSSPSNDILLAFTTDAGTTWTQNLINNAVDGLGVQDRIDPRCIHDRFGNLYVCYFTRNPRSMVVLQSFDAGATFPNQQVVFTNASIDKEFLVTGPNGANPAQEAIYVGWDDSAGAATGVGGIVASGATCAGPGMALSAFSPAVQVASSVALGGPQQFSNADVAPNGDLVVVWNDRSADVGGIGPVPIRMAIDPLGLFAGAGFGASIVVDTSNVGGFEPVPPEPVRTIFAIPDVAVMKSGPLAGRIVVSYSTEVPDNSDDLDVTVRFTDNNGLTFSARRRVNDDFTTNTQMLPAMRVDPVSGTLVMAWYDARNDAINNRQIQVFASASFDGGFGWQPNMRIADGTSDQANFVGFGPQNNEFLDYLGLRAHNGCAFVSWSDNSNFAGGGTGQCEDYVSRFQFK